MNSAGGDIEGNARDDDIPIDEIHDLKSKMRFKMKSIRYSLPGDMYRSLSERITSNLFKLPEFSNAKRVCCYVHKEKTREVITWEILRTIVEDGEKELVVPITRVDELRLDLSLVEHLDDLTPSTFGVMEPKHENLIAGKSLDAIIIPCLAVDLDGNRLGYGMGYYDRLLATLPRKIPRIAVAFEHQVARDVPITDHDQPVDIIVTERRQIGIK